MDTLKGKQIMVWTFMGNARMYEALRDSGDRISQIGLFSFKVRATGEIYESGVAISDMLTYINRWPHIKWLLTVANDGANSIFRALRDNTDGAQDRFLSEIVRIMEKYPWCDGIDIDLERGDGYSTHTESTAMFRNIYNGESLCSCKAYEHLPAGNDLGKRLGGRRKLVCLRRLRRLLRYRIHHVLRHGMGRLRTGAGFPKKLAGGHLRLRYEGHGSG